MNSHSHTNPSIRSLTAVPQQQFGYLPGCQSCQAKGSHGNIHFAILVYVVGVHQSRLLQVRTAFTWGKNTHYIRSLSLCNSKNINNSVEMASVRNSVGNAKGVAEVACRNVLPLHFYNHLYFDIISCYISALIRVCWNPLNTICTAYHLAPVMSE